MKRFQDEHDRFKCTDSYDPGQKAFHRAPLNQKFLWKHCTNKLDYFMRHFAYKKENPYF